MDRRVFCGRVSAFLALAAAEPWAQVLDAQQATGLDIPDDDSYAIWSILIPILEPGSKGYLVASTTWDTGMIEGVRARTEPHLTVMDRVRLGLSPGFAIEMKVPQEYFESFTIAAEAFQAERNRRQVLERKLTLPHRYLLMDRAALNEYSRLKPPNCVAPAGYRWHRDRGLEKKYSSFAPPSYVSRVYFDQARTLGLVFACLPDGGCTFHAFGRQGHGWQHLDWEASTARFDC